MVQLSTRFGHWLYRPIKTPFTPAIVKSVTPIFDRLASETFLEASKNVTNQNANESFNGVLWNICPKVQYNSPLEMSLGLSLAVCIYNSGLTYTLSKLFQDAVIQPHTSSLTQWRQIDKERVESGDSSVREENKTKRRKRKYSEVKRQDAFKKNEGVQYQPQGFHPNQQN